METAAVDFSGHQLGRQKPTEEHKKKRVMLSNHVDLARMGISRPDVWDGTVSAPRKMWNNNVKGCCVIAAFANGALQRAHLDGAPLDFDDAEVDAFYDKLSPNDDGLIPHDAFELILKSGFPLSGNYRIQVRCGLDPKNLEEILTAMYAFGFVLVGQELPLTAQQGGPIWTVGSGASAVPGSWGGHEEMGGGFPGRTPEGKRIIRVTTWGTTQDQDEDFFSTYTDDIEVVLDSRHLAALPDGGKSIIAEALQLATAGDYDTA